MEGCEHPFPWLTHDPIRENRAICGQCGKLVRLRNGRATPKGVRRQQHVDLLAQLQQYQAQTEIEFLDCTFHDNDEELEWP